MADAQDPGLVTNYMVKRKFSDELQIFWTSSELEMSQYKACHD